MDLSKFSMAGILGGMIFSSIGFIAFIYGKKLGSFRPMVVGIALMLYPIFVQDTSYLYMIGVALTALLYFWRE